MIFNFSLLDFSFIFYLIWCFNKGIRKGFGKELEGFIVALLFLGTLLGIYIISQLTGLIKTTLQATLLSSGFLISLASFIFAIIVFFFLRKKISEFSESHFSEHVSKYGGAAIGLLRGSVMIMIISIFLSNFPFGLFQEFHQQSLISTRIEALVKLIEPPPAPTLPETLPESDELIIGY